MTNRKSIRDFIYLDTFRVHSLASQIQGGLAERRQIERARSLETARADASENVAGVSQMRQIEERILLDHIYNELECQMESSFLELKKTISSSEWIASPFVRVSGTVEIEDYKEFTDFVSNYNELGKIIAYASFDSEKNYNSEKARNNAIAEHAKSMGLYQDQLMLNNLVSFAKLLNPDALNFLFDCVPSTGLKIRAVIDRQWLRYSNSVLRGLYSTSSIAPWTLVGMITYVPSDEAAADPEAINNRFLDGTPHMGLVYRNMFRSSHAFSNTFCRSLGDEIVVLPLAIYRQFTVQATPPTIENS